jgi:hypothetical protein
MPTFDGSIHDIIMHKAGSMDQLNCGRHSPSIGVPTCLGSRGQTSLSRQKNEHRSEPLASHRSRSAANFIYNWELALSG